MAQLYAGKTDSKVARAPWELKAFRKVAVPVGKRIEVALEIPVSKLAYYNEDLKDWDIEPGHYQLKLANASDSIVESITIEVVKKSP